MKLSSFSFTLYVLLFTLLSLSSLHIRAATVTFTGADLYSNPNAVLHSTITSLSGTSLVFAPIDVSANQFEKLVSLPLSSLGQWDNIDGAVVSISANLTRLPCQAVYGDSCGPEDHDTPIALGNGAKIVGSEIADNSNGSVYFEEFSDLGTYGERTTHNLLFQNTGFPNIGETYNVNITFTLNAGSTLVNTSFLTGTGSASGSALGRPVDLEFLLMRDNGQGEQYQLNTLSISSESLSAVPIPASALLLSSGLIGLFAFGKRKHHCDKNT